MSGPLVTVLIDTYNYGRFIEEAIDSVLAQDFPLRRTEILVIDDGSTDDTAERVKRYGSRVQYFYKPNGGQASALNFGIAKAAGDIIALLDADDYWAAGKLRRVVAEFEKHPEAGMVYHNVRQWNAQEGRYQDGGLPLISGFVAGKKKDLLSYVLYPTSFLAFRRRALEPLLPIPEELTIQADAHLSGLIVFLAPIVGVPDFLGVYRVHETNLFADSNGQSRRRYEVRLKTRGALVAGMKRWLEKWGYDTERDDLRAFFRQWELRQEDDEFRVSPPGRLRICRHLINYGRFYGPQISQRHRVVTYINALGSLAVGYRNVHRLDAWRLAVKQKWLAGRRALYAAVAFLAGLAWGRR